MSNSLWPHGLQHNSPPCPSPTPRVYSNFCPLCRWCHPTISSSVIPFSSCLRSFPASGSFPVSQFFASCGQNIAVSASASVLPMNIQDWFPLGWAGWISLQSKGLWRVFSNTTVQKHPFLGAQLSLNHSDSIFPSIRVFSNESVLHIRWPKYCSFSFSIIPLNEHSGLISFRMYWLDLLALQGTLKSLLQHHSLKASILWCSAFFMTQISHPYMTTGKTIALLDGLLLGK